MKAQSLLLALALSALALSPTANAEQSKPVKQRHNFTRDATHTTGKGRTVTSHTEQVVTDTGFNRSTTVSAPNGKTASRDVVGTYDPVTKTYTKSIDGTRMNGNQYSADAVTTRTEDGYERHSTATNAAGKTATRDAVVTVDKENKTVTKEITATGFNGKTQTTTVVKTGGGTADVVDSGAAE